MYVENDGKANPRHIDHVALRTMRPGEMATFQCTLFKPTPTNMRKSGKNEGDPNHNLIDGKGTLVNVPWRMKNDVGQSLLPQAWIIWASPSKTSMS